MYLRKPPAPLAPEAPPTRSLTGDSAIITGLAAILFLGAAALAAWIVLTDYVETRASARASISNLASALQNDVARTVAVFDTAIQEASEASHLPGIAESSPAVRRAAIFSRVATTEFMSSIVLLDASGDVREESRQAEPPAINLADREYFQFVRDHPEAGLYIGVPIRSRLTGKDIVVFCRRITNADGSFGGVVVDSVETNYFTTLFESLQLGADGTASLIRSDGIVLARHPSGPGRVGSSVGEAESFQTMLDHESGVLDGVSSVDHVERTYAYHHVGALPLLVAVSFSKETAFHAWRKKMSLIVIAVSSLISLGAVLIMSLRLQLDRRGAAERRAVEAAEQAKRSERNLKVAFERIDDVFRHSADAQFAASPRADGRFALDLLNRRGEELTGLAAENVIGKTPEECLPPGHGATIAQNWATCLATGEPHSYDYSVTDAAGVRHWETLLVPVRGVDGATYRLIGTMRDVTERKQAEAELVERNVTLEQRAAAAAAAQADALARASVAERLQMLGRLASGVAHDFNNVLQSVGGCAAIIERRAEEPNTMRHAAQLITDAVARGGSITQRLLSFARADATGGERIGIASMLADVADILRHTLQGAGRIEIVTQVDDEALSVQAEVNQLKTVLLNLATNARDAMPDGGRLVLGAAAETVTPGTARLAAGEYVRLWVKDSGFGMDAATLARATEPFFTTKPLGHGTGLGLSMARTYAEGCGGALLIDSGPGLGTTVSLWLRG